VKDATPFDENMKFDKDGKELCRNFRNRSKCSFGDKCEFSHEAGPPIGDPKPRRRRRRGASDVVKAPGLCFNFRDDGACKYKDECRFKHGEDDKRELVQPGAKRKAPGECYQFLEKGECQFGDDCRFAHGDEQDGDEADQDS